MYSDSIAPYAGSGSAQQSSTVTADDGDLVTLARSSDVKVRASVAAHPCTPLTTLLKLAEDPAAEVRRGVARNTRRGIPVQVHEDLARDGNCDVIYALIDNPVVPTAVIARLGRQVHRAYSRAARARLADARKGVAFEGVRTDPTVPELPRQPRAVAAVYSLELTQPRSRAEAIDILLAGGTI